MVHRNRDSQTQEMGWTRSSFLSDWFPKISLFNLRIFSILSIWYKLTSSFFVVF